MAVAVFLNPVETLHPLFNGPFGTGQSAFQITAQLVIGFCAGQQNLVVPDTIFPVRRIEQGMLMGTSLVKLCGSEPFLSPIL